MYDTPFYEQLKSDVARFTSDSENGRSYRRMHGDNKTPVSGFDLRGVPERTHQEYPEEEDTRTEAEKAAEDAEYQRESLIDARERGLKDKAERNAKEGWTTPEPDWYPGYWRDTFTDSALNTRQWHGVEICENEFFPKATIRLDLSPDVQARLTFGVRDIHESIDRDGKIGRSLWHDLIDIRVWYQGRSYEAALESSVGDMCWEALVIEDPRDEIPQDVVTRAAYGMHIDEKDWPVGLYAAMSPSERCQACKRKLRDPVSKILQYGPVCAKDMGLPHNEDLAHKVVLHRKARQEKIDALLNQSKTVEQ